MKKVEKIDDIIWKSICLPPDEVRKIMSGDKQMFVFRQRFYGKRNKRWFWKWDHVFIRELWQMDPRDERKFLYEVDGKFEWMEWKPPQQMLRQAARLFIQIIRIGKCRLWEIPLRWIRLLGFDSKLDFISHWNKRYWRVNDCYESNPAVNLYRFRRITVKRMDGRPVVKSKDEW